MTKCLGMYNPCRQVLDVNRSEIRKKGTQRESHQEKRLIASLLTMLLLNEA